LQFFVKIGYKKLPMDILWPTTNRNRDHFPCDKEDFQIAVGNRKISVSWSAE
jgi:hypothetical protein